MAFFIKIDENNSPIGHPYDQANLEQLYPNHNWSNGPMAGYLEFISEEPNRGIYQKFDETIGADIALAYKHNGLEYKLVDGKIKQVWHYINMTDEEKKTMQDNEKASWEALDPPGPASWVFHEDRCQYGPPVALPADALTPDNPEGKIYEWDESTTSWKETT